MQAAAVKDTDNLDHQTKRLLLSRLNKFRRQEHPLKRDRSIAQERARLVKELESQMKIAAKALEFEKAALLRDQIVELRRSMQ